MYSFDTAAHLMLEQYLWRCHNGYYTCNLLEYMLPIIPVYKC